MYKGFNLSLNDDLFQDYYKTGEQLNTINESAVKDALDSFLGANGKIDGSKLQEHWFPQIKADVFISHSHKDRDTALGLAGWLSESFGLKPFIDSCVWGYANDLLQEIDNKYSLLTVNQSVTTYEYLHCNRTSAHVHMMLATALQMMINNTECLFFLNTPNAITSADAASKTASPWIYMEIVMTRFVHRQLLRSRSIEKGKSFIKAKKEPEFTYRINLDHLVNINDEKLKSWQHMFNREYHALDYLYMITGGA